MRDSRYENILTFIYGAGIIGTFVYLTFFDGYVYNWWNWIIAIPINVMLSGVFPIYWLILHWIF